MPKTERKTIRRKGQAVFYDAITDRRRPQFERRETVPQEAPPTREQKLFGERRQNPNER
jgi:hypothetical protein